MEQDKVKNQITEGVIWKQLLIFFFPIALGTIFQQLYTVADTIIVGRFLGKEALASVGGSAAMVVNIAVGFFSGFATGASVVISQNYGAKNTDGIHKALHTAYCFSILAGLILGIAGWICTPKLLLLMNTPAETMPGSVTYLRIYCIGLMATFTYNMGSSIMRAVGDSKRPLYVLTACSLLNILLDVVLIVIFRLGIAGAAIATIASQFISALVVSRLLISSYEDITLRVRQIRIDAKILIEELRIGLPGGIQFCISGITNVLLQSAINSFGTDTIAAWAAFNKMDMIFWTVCGAFGASITTFAGQNYGAKKYDRVFKSVQVCLLLSIVICGSLQILFMIFANPLFTIFTSDASVIRAGVYILRFLVPTYILFVLLEIPAGALRGIGDAAAPTAINMIGLCLIRLPWILFAVPRYHKLSVILISYPLAGICSCVLIALYYFYRKRKILLR